MRFNERYRDAQIAESHTLHQLLKNHQNEIKNATPQKHNHALRVLGIALGAIALTTLVLNQYNITWHELSCRIRQLAHTKLNLKMKLILGAAGILVLGALYIIHKVTRDTGKFWGNEHYKPVVLLRAPHEEKKPGIGDEYFTQHLVDMSAVKDGKTIAVQRKEGEHNTIAIVAALTAPLQAIGSIAYNVIRFVIIPFYIIGRLIQEACTGAAVYRDQRCFYLSDIPKQMALSVYWAVCAPFYATAYFFAALYALLDPMGGRKLGQLVNQEWMGGIERYESIWHLNGPMGGYQLEGGGGPDKLGHHAFYITGCWLSWATVEVENGQITRATYPGGLFEYDIYEHEDAGHFVPDLMELPEKMDVTEEPMELARKLPLGHYRCIKKNGQLYLIAHVTRLSDQMKLYIAHQIAEMPKDRDLFLNQLVRVGAYKESGQISNEMIINPPTKRDPQDRLDTKVTSYCMTEPSVTMALDLEKGQWSRIDVQNESYILAHTVDEWGEHLFIKKRLLEGEDTNFLEAYPSAYIRGAINRRNKKEFNLFGYETDQSIARRKSLSVIKRHMRAG